jgi:alanyl-tRNA synthetase
MTSAEIRQSFLDFFKSKQHTVVPSSSLLPDAPNLLFTNAGMNQFVPIFLGQAKCPYTPGRATDTQKCIRAGGKHNDLEDVGLDTYHHTFFEMLGNWSFGDYFKREAIDWAWELITEVWRLPSRRLYATVYRPDKSRGEPSEMDREAGELWAEKFGAAGLDPQVHLQFCGKQDNFWMMGDTGPCGPCSELHIDLTPEGKTRGALVNQGSGQCIELWNLVFIQFNANPDGTLSPLPARHVDTGMGFERVAGIMQNTRGFADFSRVISNYETDIFRPLFDKLESLSGKHYASTLPKPGTKGETAQEKIDVAFRVIADHIRTLSFAIADGIQPGNTDRNYVLRRILRRAVRYGRWLGFHEPFFYRLADVLADTMGDVFPELRARQKHVREVIGLEEEAFNRTLDRGLELFCQETANLQPGQQLCGDFAFKLYDTYGFPLDLTELMAQERGLTVAAGTFGKLMEEQRALARAAQKKTVVSLSQIETTTPTRFVGYDTSEVPARVLEVVRLKDKTAVVLDTSACYAEMGGQVGDSGELSHGGELWRIVDTQRIGETWLHLLGLDDHASRIADHSESLDIPTVGSAVTLTVDKERRAAIQRHHTVTHLLHWALHEVVSPDAAQKGSFVGPDKLTFDFNSAPLTPAQVAEVERLVNERILQNAPVSWAEIPYAQVRNRKDVRQFFGEKYGEAVRVVQIGGGPGQLDGYSMELCGGTHVRATGEIGLFRILGEAAIAAGVRRLEAVAGLCAYQKTKADAELITALAGRVNSPAAELERKIASLLEQQRQLEKQLRAVQQKQAVSIAKDLLARARAPAPSSAQAPCLIENLGAGDADFLQGVADALRGEFKGVVVLGGIADGAVAFVATVSPEFTGKVQAGKILQAIAPIVGGRGGGKRENARGGGKDAAKLDEALAKARALLG